MAMETAPVRLEKQDLDQLKSLAATQGVTLSEYMRETLTQALQRDDATSTANELARLCDETKDLRAEILQLRSNLSIVLELVLRNAPGSQEEVDAVLQQLRERRLIR